MNKRSSLVSHQYEEGMNLTYSQSVQPPRPARDWSWERGPDLWTRRSPLELPPISWGSPQIVGGLVQDRLHSQNQTWANRINDSDSSYYSISDLDSSIEIDPSGSLLDHLDRGVVPVPVHVPEDPGSREPQGRPPVIPGTLSTLPKQWNTPRQPRLARRSDWWLLPQVPLYRSLYERPRYTHVLGYACVWCHRVPSHHQGSHSCRRPGG